jgi:hypothetical protein
MLQCTICNVIVKNVVLWEKHAKSVEHITGLKMLREKMAKNKQEEEVKKDNAELVAKEKPQDEPIELIKDNNTEVARITTADIEDRNEIAEQVLNQPENPNKQIHIKNKLLKILSEDTNENSLPKVTILHNNLGIF